MKYLPSLGGALLLLGAWCFGGLPSAAAAEAVQHHEEQPSWPSYLTSIHQVAPGNGRRYLLGTGAVVHSSDRALIVLSSNDIDFWEGTDRISLANQEEEMIVRFVLEDDEVPERPSLLVLRPLRNPTSVRPIDIHAGRITPGDNYAAVGFEKSGKAREYGVSMLAPRDCAALPHVRRSTSFVFDQAADVCVDNGESVGSIFYGEASGPLLVTKRGGDGSDYLVGISPPDGPGGVFVNIAQHGEWVRFAIEQILNPPEEVY